MSPARHPLSALLLAVAAFAPASALARPLGVEVWTDRGDDAVYQPGDAMTIKVRTSDDAHLLVYEIDTDGRIQVLYPWRRGSGFVEGRSTLRLPPEGSRTELVVERSTGQGYLVAIASREPFRDLPWYLRPYDPQAESVGYEDEDDPRRDPDEDLTGFDEDGRLVGDPYVGMERIRRRVLGRPSDSEDFASSYASYYVNREVRYPRYVCYDCHAGNRWQWWDGFDPYHTTCSVFDLRVNWSWCWGPCGWTTRVPYYYYVVRSDCPPRYRRWYDRRVRLSSWDDRHAWNDLWGGPLRRIKSDPPAGYVPPAPGGGWGQGGGAPDVGGPRYKPPGYMDSPRVKGGTSGLPIGRRTRPGSETPSDLGGSRGRPERMPSRPAPREDEREEPRPSRDPGHGRRESPRWEPREKPQDPTPAPRVEPQREPQRKPDPPPPPREKPSSGEGRGGKGGGGGGGGKGGSGGGGKGGGG